MSSENATYSGRRTGRRIAESNPIEGGASIFTSKNGGSNTEAMKLYEAIIFSGPIVFTLIILFLFYFFYLRRSVDWSSLRMRASNSAAATADSDDVGVAEMGLKKEFREMLPVIVFKESFTVSDTR
ncbi:RING-H2 finger protein ATL7 [Bienertia sinuspersici]